MQLFAAIKNHFILINAYNHKVWLVFCQKGISIFLSYWDNS